MARYKVVARNLLGFESQFSLHRTKAAAKKAAKRLRRKNYSGVRISKAAKKFHRIGW